MEVSEFHGTQHLLANMHIKTDLRKFFKGFSYAAEGIFHCIKTQRNMRFHIGAAVLVLIFSLICEIRLYEGCIIFLTVGGVFALECVNTALESAVDLCTKEKNKLAKAAKDCAAGAVLIFCIFALCIGIYVFMRSERIFRIIGYLRENPFAAIGIVLFVILWLIWVFRIDNNINKDKD